LKHPKNGTLESSEKKRMGCGEDGVETSPTSRRLGTWNHETEPSAKTVEKADTTKDGRKESSRKDGKNNETKVPRRGSEKAAGGRVQRGWG